MFANCWMDFDLRGQGLVLRNGRNIGICRRSTRQSFVYDCCWRACLFPYYHRDEPTLSYEYWCRDGGFYRDGDEPAMIVRQHNLSGVGTCVHEMYWLYGGRPHRDNDEPAMKRYYINGTLISEDWVLNGNSYRRNLKKPISVQYHRLDGTLKNALWLKPTKSWYDTNMLLKTYRHGDGGTLELTERLDSSGRPIDTHVNDPPTVIWWYEDGQTRRRLQWMLDEYVHRGDGKPAVIEYAADGRTVLAMEWRDFNTLQRRVISPYIFWEPKTHRLFPPHTRHALRCILLMANRCECCFWQLSRELLFHIFDFITADCWAEFHACKLQCYDFGV